jgi:hypothetical protein
VTRADVFAAIERERERQAIKWTREHDWGYGDCSSLGVASSVKGVVLTEECGEVARAILEKDALALRVELIQVAAVCVAWLESL